MDRITIISRGDARCAERLATLFNDGNRLHVDLIFTDTDADGLTKRLDGTDAKVLAYDNIESDGATLAENIKANPGTNVLVVENAEGPLPAEITELFGDNILTVNDPSQAPRQLVAFLARDTKPLGQQETTAGTPATPDSEWAEALHMEFDPETAEKTVQIEENVEEVRPQPVAVDNRQRNSGLPDTPQPKSYLAWAIVMTIVFNFIAGVVAIIYASSVTSRWQCHDIAGAEKASERAQAWIIVSFVVGVLTQTLYLPILLIS